MYQTTNNVQNRSRQENVFQTIEKEKPPQSYFDLSFDHKLTFSMGQLVPFCLYETLPGDRFELANDVLLRFSTLFLPLYHRINLKTWYFYLPNRVMWQSSVTSGSSELFYDGFEHFITDYNGDKVPWAYINVQAQSLKARPNTVIEYMGFPTPESTVADGWNININVLPIIMYHTVWNDFFRNAWVQDPLELNAIAGDNTANMDVAFSGTKDWLMVRRRNWNPDYYTAALPTPQATDNPLQIPMTAFNTSNFFEDNNIKGPWQFRRQDTDLFPTADSTVTANSPTATLYGENSMKAGGIGVYVDVQSTAATIAQLRLNMSLQAYMERVNRSGDRYRDFLRGMWGEDPSPARIDFTELISSSSAVVNISDVMSTSYTDIGNGGGTTTPLGFYAGKMIAMDSAQTKVFTAPEHGFIMGIVNVQPRSSYFQGLHKLWRRTSPLDYASPYLAGIGDQAIKQEEVVLDYSDPTTPTYTWEDTFGYVPRYSEYRYQNDIVSGEMRYIIPNTAWHMGRRFETVHNEVQQPLLNTEFLECKPTVWDNFTTIEDPSGQNINHEIFAHIWNNVKVWRSVPKYGIPTV